jgi:hypothetical protein
MHRARHDEAWRDGALGVPGFGAASIDTAPRQRRTALLRLGDRRFAPGRRRGRLGTEAGNHTASPAAATCETVAARWLLDILDLPRSAPVGFVTGATVANFVALAAARGEVLRRIDRDVEAKGLFGAPPIRVLIGDDAHSTVFRALRYLGPGSGTGDTDRDVTFGLRARAARAPISRSASRKPTPGRRTATNGCGPRTTAATPSCGIRKRTAAR